MTPTVIVNGTALSPAEIAALSSYHYIPSRAVALIMLGLFGLSTLIHFGLAARYRLLWLLPTICLCGIGEAIGWSGRLWSSYDPLNSTAFKIQFTCTIIAPTPFLAANFIIFGRLIRTLGFKYSRLRPRWYTIIFCTCDIVSLGVQAAGGGIAAGSDTKESSDLEAHIMVGGIAFQLFVIVMFTVLSVEYFVRYYLDKPVRYDWTRLEPESTRSLTRSSQSLIKLREKMTKNRAIMSCTFAFTTTVLFIRAIYRLIELLDGWHGRIISNELYFNVFDATMIVIVMFTMVFLHPGRFLSESEAEPLYQMKTRERA